jgi:hypothetical protein
MEDGNEGIQHPLPTQRSQGLCPTGPDSAESGEERVEAFKGFRLF